MRDLAKTASFAVLHFSVGFGVTYLLTGSAAIATGVALIEPAVNTVVFFYHERIWARFPEVQSLEGWFSGGFPTALFPRPDRLLKMGDAR